MRTRTLAAGVLAAAALTTSACQLPQAATDSAATSPTEAAGKADLGDYYAPGPQHLDTYERALAQLDRIRTAPETDVDDTYDRDDWPHWTEENGCSTRQTVLAQQGVHVNRFADGSMGDQAIEVDDDCQPLDGDQAGGLGNQWYSEYDDTTHYRPADVDVDHVVPLKEAAESGTGHWTREQRERYANDPLVLEVVTDELNQSKSDGDPTEWLPPHEPAVCLYVVDWTRVKHDYAMTMDAAEKRLVRGELTDCVAAANSANNQ